MRPRKPSPSAWVRLRCPPLLPLFETVATTLGDTQQRTWLIRQQTNGDLRLEIAGCNLLGAAIWFAGDWVASAKPSRDVIEPESGKPFLLTAMGSLRTRDQLEINVLVTRDGAVTVSNASVVDENRALERDVKLTEQQRLIFNVDQAGNYRVDTLEGTAAARYRIEPYMENTRDY